ncbi:ATP-binding protein [Stenotrophomonas sp. NA06056]|uniref:AlbA family DNA-binding domain-containing protein n=1 Tax=Stenotrophomonas sp. NA06056 TaxID=2742129 RepID=UPI00158E027A|nr:ATP-binding protein [Stenotrophomonas sp. NA06056]QKW57071.1 ATP-binding protein [Stenotrophomonas sp. NA06056]
MDLTTQLQQVVEGVQSGKIGAELEGIFFPLGSPVPAERDLWDYKADFRADKLAYAELAKDITAFHNSYGGYILIGVNEKIRDEIFETCGYNRPQDFVISLKGAIDSYCSSQIPISVGDIFPQKRTVAYIFIPRRTPESPPVFLQRNGPDIKPGKPIFLEKTTYFRQGDRSLPATISQQWEFLNGLRNPDELLTGRNIVSSATPSSRIIPNNLPDRNVICSHLYGREDILSDLWAWIADELEPVRLLAGAGGKGKTSIAYEFASRFFRNAPLPYIQVLWLSAKKRQFRADRNDFVDLPHSWYENPRELLESLCLNTAAILDGQESEETEYTLQKKLRTSLKEIPSFIIVDDIDSLEANEQRRVFEIVQQLSAGANSKFLLTTRANYAFSNEQCIVVGGLRGEAYISFVKDRVRRLGLSDLSHRDRDRLAERSDGSPLWTESMLRLMRQGYTFDDAVSEWFKKPGEDARAAALKKEISALGPSAKRILFVASVLRECSRAELLDVTKLGMVEFDDALTELQTLFLVDAPKIIKNEPRFSVPESTAAAVFDAQATLVADPERLRRSAQEYLQRATSSDGKAARSKVGLAINQTMALLKSSQLQEALATVDQALNRDPKNPDLLLLRGRCLRDLDTAKAVEAFSLAHQFGQRKPLLFDLWYSASESLEQHAATLDVANLAVDFMADNAKWLPLRARAYVQIALMRNRDSQSSSSIELLLKAASDIRESITLTRHSTKEAEAHRADLRSIHDVAWKLASGQDAHSNLQAFDVAVTSLTNGDYREECFERLVSSTSKLATNVASQGPTVSRGARSRISRALRALQSIQPSRLGTSRAAIWKGALLAIESMG